VRVTNCFYDYDYYDYDFVIAIQHFAAAADDRGGGMTAETA